MDLKDLNLKKKFNSIFGLVPVFSINKIRKILFRISRENIVVKTLNLDDIKDEVLEKFF